MISSVDRRSEYVENRAGANVRLNNFLTPYTLDDKSSILNAPCGYSNGVYASLRPASSTSIPLTSITVNYGQPTREGWNWNGSILTTNPATGNCNFANNIFLEHKVFIITFKILSYVSGDLGYRFGGGAIRNNYFNSELIEGNTIKLSVRSDATVNNFQFLTTNFNGSLSDITFTQSPAGDFEFTRGSAATRVTKDGLIKNVQILSDDLVQNGDFSQIGSEEVTDGDFSQIGSELITNGDFATDTNWTKGTGWSISGGSANCDGTQTSETNLIQTNLPLGTNKIFKIEFELKNYQAGELIYVNLTGTGILEFENINVNGTYVAYSGLSTGDNFITFRANADFIGSIENVSVKEVGQDWTFGTDGVNITDNGVRIVSDGAYQRVTQYSILTVGKNYKIQYEIVENNSGQLKMNNSFGLTPIPSTVGVHTVYAEALETFLAIERNGACDVTITNISVKEVGQNWELSGLTNIVDGGVSFIDNGTNTFSYVQQLGILTSGRKYRVSFDVIRYVSGLAQIELGTINTPVDISSGVGTYTIESEADNTFGLIKRDGSSPNFDFDVSNISIIEITDDTDLPRINYTNGTGSLLLEPQSTNTATYSNDFTQGDIFNQSADPSLGASVLTQNQEKAPDGTNNGWLLKDNNNSGTGATGLQYFSTRVNSDDFNTISIFAKKALSNDFLILESSGYDVSATGRSYFNISNGSLGDISTSHTAKIEDYGNGWYRCSITFQTTTDVQGAIYARLASSNGQVNITRDGTNGVYIFGLQCEADATQNYATSYIPTSGSTVTRNQDLCINAGSSDLINSIEGVLYAEISALDNDGTFRLLSLSDGTGSNRVYLGFNNIDNTITASVTNAGVLQALINYTTSDSLLFNKVAVKYKNNAVSLYVNGIEVGVDTSVTIPSSLNSLQFTSGALASDFYGRARSVAVFKEALTDEELAKITSTTQQEAFYEMRDKMLQINADYYEFGDYTTRLKKLF
jgi:hypothetical protein